MRPIIQEVNITNGVHNTGTAVILFALKEWIDTDIQFDFDTNTVLEDIELIAGKKFIEIPFTPESYDYKEDPKESDSGVFFATQLSGSCNYLSPLISELLEAIRFRECLVIAYDKSGNIKLIGNKESGAKIQYNNANPSTDQTVTVTATFDQENLNPFYTGNIAIATISEAKTLLGLASSGDFELQSGLAPRGFCSIKFAPKDWFREMADIFNNNVLQFKFKADKHWIAMQFMPRTYLFEQKPKAADSGDFFEFAVTGSLSAITPEVQQILETIRHHEHVVCCTNAQGKEVFIGNQDHGMKLKFGFKQPYNKQEVEVQLYIEQEDPVYYFSESAKKVLTTEDGDVLITEDGIMLEG